VSERNSDYLWKTELHFTVERCLNRLAKAHIGNSQRVCAYGEKNLHLSPGTFRLMYNGVDTSEFYPDIAPVRARGAAPVIGTVANLQPKKDLRTFVEMAARVHARHPRTRYVIVGYGPEQAALQRQARELGIQSSITFVGLAENVAAMYRQFDIFVLTSVHEGFANVIVEAMASGVPVVATDVGGAPDAIEEGECGYVVPPRDPAALANRACRLLDAEALRIQMGRAARNRALSHFSLDAMVRRYCDLYDELTTQRPPRARDHKASATSGDAMTTSASAATVR
jgi:glycosyltransferase involved in cell wall biosynthesis